MAVLMTHESTLDFCEGCKEAARNLPTWFPLMSIQHVPVLCGKEFPWGGEVTGNLPRGSGTAQCSCPTAASVLLGRGTGMGAVGLAGSAEIPPEVNTRALTWGWEGIQAAQPYVGVNSFIQGRTVLMLCQQASPWFGVCGELLLGCSMSFFPPQVAILIPFRNRYEHLPVLFRHLIPMLQRQRLQFAFYVVEQVSGHDGQRW